MVRITTIDVAEVSREALVAYTYHVHDALEEDLYPEDFNYWFKYIWKPEHSQE